MQTDLLVVDNQNVSPSKKTDYGKGLIEGDRGRGRGETDFSSTLAKVANEQPSHSGAVDESKTARKKIEDGEAESEDLKKDANGETESEDLKKDVNEDLAKTVKTSGPFLVLDKKTDAASGNKRVAVGEELPGSGLKKSSAKLKVVNKGVRGLNQVNPETPVSKVDPTGSGVERKQGDPEVEKVAATPRGLEKAEGALRELALKPATKGNASLEVAPKRTTKDQLPSEVSAKPQGLEKTAGILREMDSKLATKGEVPSEVSAKSQSFEKAASLLHEMGAKPATKAPEPLKAAVKSRSIKKGEGFLKDFGQESVRTDRGVQDKEPAAQKLQLGGMKGAPEMFAQKEPGVDAATPRLGLEPKDARAETVKMNVAGGDLAHKKVEKTESNSGENSNLFSRNYSAPDKGIGTISSTKEPQAFTKSSQTDTLKQIVNKAAFNLENGRSEFKIELKPESLGHIKMQILTENHHVTVRILAENPLVKDMIESNLSQLKANFQNQGLEIEKIDVSVAQDSNKNDAGDGDTVERSKKLREKLTP